MPESDLVLTLIYEQQKFLNFYVMVMRLKKEGRQIFALPSAENRILALHALDMCKESLGGWPRLAPLGRFENLWISTEGWLEFTSQPPLSVKRTWHLR
jgi:hypothetical protein